MESKEKKCQNYDVLHLVLSLGIGGAERIVISLIQGEDASPVTHAVCCIDEKGILGDDLEAHGYPVHLLKRKTGVDLRLPLRLARFASRHGVKVIHAHGETPWFYSIMATIVTLGLKFKCITTVHGYSGGDNSRLKNINLWRFLLLFSTRTFAVSTSLMHEIKMTYALLGYKVRVILNGIPSNVMKEPQSRYTWGLTDEIVLGIVSRLSHVKNHALLLRAAANLIKRDKINLKVMIVGDGPERTHLEESVKSLEIEDSIIFTGECSDALGFYPLFDLFVLPSLSEGISIALLEALTSGIPCIASNVGGNTEVLTHLENGLIFQSGNVDDLVGKIKRLVEEPLLSEKLSLNAMRSIKQRFSVHRMVEAYGREYRELVES